MKNSSTRSSSARHNARMLLVQKLFEREVKNHSPIKFDTNDLDFADLLEIDEISKYSKPFFEELSNYLTKNIVEIDKFISRYSTSRPIHELPLVDLMILRVAITEKYFSKSTPDKVIINESVELAKELGGIEDGGFVNAVLDNMFTKEIQS